MAGSAGSGKPRTGSDQSLGDLIAVATKDVSQLVRYEIDLAKSELRGDIRRLAIGGALAGIAAFFGVLILGSLFFAYAYLLHEVAHLPGGLAAAYGVVAFTFLLLGVIAGLVAFRVIKRMSGMKKTRDSVSEGLGMLRRGHDGDQEGGRKARKRLAKSDETREAIGASADGKGELETAGHEPPR